MFLVARNGEGLGWALVRVWTHTNFLGFKCVQLFEVGAYSNIYESVNVAAKCMSQ